MCVCVCVCLRTSLRKQNNPPPSLNKKVSLSPAHLSTGPVGLQVTVVRSYLSLRITISPPNSCHLLVQRRKSLTVLKLKIIKLCLGPKGLPLPFHSPLCYSLSPHCHSVCVNACTRVHAWVGACVCVCVCVRTSFRKQNNQLL